MRVRGGTNAGSSASAKHSATARLGFQATTWGATAIVANRAGTWKSAGASVTARALSSGKDVRDGILGGSLDAGSLGATPFIVGAAKGQVTAVAVGAYAGNTLAVVVGKNSDIHNIADLKGKKIGSQLGSTTNQIFVDKIAKSAGLTKSDYQLVNIKFQDMYSALATGQVDAFAGVDPTPTLAVVKGTGRILTTYEHYDPTPLYLCFTKPFIKAHPGAVQKTVNGWVAAAKLFKSDPNRVDTEVKAFFDSRGASIKMSVLQKALKNLDVTPDFRKNTDQYLTQQAKSLIGQGAISSVPDWSKAIDARFLKKAESGS
ncbi:MAG: ABC transporter substrate-binding protein [Sciscionella sp.]